LNSTTSLTTAPNYTLAKSVVHYHPGAWQLIGTGIFSWSVFKLYRASLFALGEFDPGRPYALELSYLRAISAEQIVTTTLREIERLCAPETSQIKDWAVALLNIVPDVRLGDRLVGLFLPNEGVKFFSEHAYLGEIMDAQFTQAFAAIWLDPQTRSPSLRLQLLGGGF